MQIMARLSSAMDFVFALGKHDRATAGRWSLLLLALSRSSINSISLRSDRVEVESEPSLGGSEWGTVSLLVRGQWRCTDQASAVKS